MFKIHASSILFIHCKQLNDQTIVFEKHKQFNDQTIVFEKNEPTFYDLRLAHGRCTHDNRLILFNNKIVRASCNQKLSKHGITTGSFVIFVCESVNSHLSKLLDTRLECGDHKLFLCNDYENKINRLLQNASIGHYSRCKCPSTYKICYIRDSSYFTWVVEQDYYKLSQHSFNHKNICIWHIDILNGNNKIMSTALDIVFCNPRYDYDHDKVPKGGNADADAEAKKSNNTRHACVDIKCNKYLLHETYQLRLNRPVDTTDLKAYFHATGFSGEQTLNTKMLRGLSLKFVISNSSHEEYATEICHVSRIGIKDITKLVASYIF